MRKNLLENTNFFKIFWGFATETTYYFYQIFIVLIRMQSKMSFSGPTTLYLFKIYFDFAEYQASNQTL